MVIKQLDGEEIQNMYEYLCMYQVENLIFEVKSGLHVTQVCRQIWSCLGFKLVI